MSEKRTCRLCLSDSEKSKCVSLYKGNTAEMLEYLTGFKIADSAMFLPSICQLCFQELKDAVLVCRHVRKMERQYREVSLTNDFVNKCEQLELKIIDDSKSNEETLIRLSKEQLETQLFRKNKENKPAPEFPYMCNLCPVEQGFQYRYEFMDHMKQHIMGNVNALTGTFLCPLCPQMFKLSAIDEIVQHAYLHAMTETPKTSTTVKEKTAFPMKCDLYRESQLFLSKLYTVEHLRRAHQNFANFANFANFGSGKRAMNDVEISCDLSLMLAPYGCGVWSKKFKLQYFFTEHLRQHLQNQLEYKDRIMCHCGVACSGLKMYLRHVDYYHLLK